MTIRHVIYVLAGMLALTTPFLIFRPASPAASARAPGTSMDWSQVSSSDLNIAAVFLTARDRGVRKALDSLEILAAGDAKIRSRGHALAHALGRYAIAEKKDIGVLAECREVFEAGCYHGVLEGYLAELEDVKPALVASLCEPVGRAHAERLPVLECAHGLGHGLLARFGYSLEQATRLCDALAEPDARRECLDGVFMENVVHGTGGATINAGDASVEAHQHGASHETTPRTYFRATDLAFPCDSVVAAYQPACWSYQPLAVMVLTGNDPATTIRQCDEAPSASRASCYRAVGKQGMGWFGWRGDKVLELCARGAPEMLGTCIAGSVEALIDVAWKPDEALAFCTSVQAGAKTRCYAEIGARMRLVHADDGAVARDCERAPRDYVATCRDGARRVGT